MGRVFASAGRYDEGHEALTQAIRLSSQIEDKEGEAAALINLGALCLDSRRLQEALSAYQRALDLSPDNVDALNGRNEVLKKMSELESMSE
jgi:tetratricopeptide (TPR) repeat protein